MRTEQRRNALMKGRKERGIDTRPYFYPMSSLPMYKQTPLPVSTRKAQILLNPGPYFELTKDDVIRSGEAVNELRSQLHPII
jgi:perosamine synthetase